MMMHEASVRVASKRWAWLVALLMAWAVVVTGCGDDGGEAPEPSSDRLSDEAPAVASEGLTLTSANTGVGLQWGDLPLIQTTDALDVVTTSFGSAVIVSQVIDERAARQGNPNDVRNELNRYQPRKRLGDLLEEVDDVVVAGGKQDWSGYVVVFDLMRMSGEWLLRWDGVNFGEFTGEGAYGLWRDDMRDEVNAALLAGVDEFKASNHTLTHVVIGMDMERLMLLNPEDFANFVTFYVEAKDAIKAAHPDLKISAGINWDRFVQDIAAFYTPNGTVTAAHGSAEGGASYSDVRAAWRDVVGPLVSASDFIALSTAPDPNLTARPDELPDTYYGLVGEFQRESDKPVVWYRLNWPITSKANKVTQRDFLRRFLELNGGYSIDLVSWQAMVDYGPTECAQVESVQGPQEDCFAGMFSDSVAPTSVSDEFVELLGQ